MNPSAADALLKWLLRIVGGVELCAIPFIVIPLPLMDAVHSRILGLGPLPHAPIVEYMAHSLSALYAVHGAVVFRLSFDVPRFRDAINFLGWAHVALGLTVLGIDIASGMTWWWTLGEGPGIAVGAVLVLVLARLNGPPAAT